jgi:hypothetical protein
MLVPVAFFPDPVAGLRAEPPDLPACGRAAATEASLLPMVRLAIEDELTRRLLAGEPLPETRDGVPPAGNPVHRGPRWLTIHINLDHLRALARHQRGRS